MQSTATPDTASTSGRAASSTPQRAVREYVGAMARELASMARWDGDEALATLLDAAAEVADRPQA